MGILKNFRRGFATNSSSSHSLVYWTDPSKVSDDYDGTDFGWNMFRLVSREAKRAYLRAEGGSWDSPYGYVDHQSIGTLPDEYVDNDHVGVIGGNDNNDDTLEEIRRLRDSGLIDIDKMIELGMIDKWFLRELDNDWD